LVLVLVLVLVFSFVPLFHKSHFQVLFFGLGLENAILTFLLLADLGGVGKVQVGDLLGVGLEESGALDGEVDEKLFDGLGVKKASQALLFDLVDVEVETVFFGFEGLLGVGFLVFLEGFDVILLGLV